VTLDTNGTMPSGEQANDMSREKQSASDTSAGALKERKELYGVSYSGSLSSSESCGISVAYPRIDVKDSFLSSDDSNVTSFDSDDMDSFF